MKSENPFLIENISLWQLFVLITNFELGSAIVVGIGNEARQDAWIAALIAMTIGIGLAWFFHRLCMLNPHRNLYEIFGLVYGRILAIVLSSVYFSYFFYLASRVLRDFGELMVSAVLPNTPLEVIVICFMFLVSYIVYLGLEIVGRTSEIFSPYLVLFLLLLGVFLVIGSQFHLKNLQPVFAEGYKPIIKAVFPTMITFPYGEMIVFVIIMAQVTHLKHAGKTAVISALMVGLALVLSITIQIGTLGVDQRIRSNFPLLSAAREISIADFIERLDSLVVFIMMLGILVKVSLFFYGGLKGLEFVFKLPYRTFVFPMAMIISLYTMLIAEDFAEHIKEGEKLVPYYLHLPLEFGIPLLTFSFAWWKSKKKMQRRTG